VVADRLSQKLAIEKALKMALIHDLPEILAGDPSPMGKDGTGKGTYYTNKKLADEKYLFTYQNGKEKTL
jgi:5'-deoxynucleotidase YfbR-like HD superfamily hydrolase